jgi:hypothetical protein
VNLFVVLLSVMQPGYDAIGQAEEPDVQLTNEELHQQIQQLQAREQEAKKQIKEQKKQSERLEARLENLERDGLR